MSTDLYKKYRYIYQKHYRDHYSDRYAKGTQLLKELCIAIHNKDDVEELLYIAHKIRDENILAEYISDSIKKDIENGDAYADVPYQVLHRWIESKNSEGWIYLAVSDSKNGQVKIGATTMDIDHRVSSYYSKYNYRIKVVWSVWVDMPFKLEKELQDCFIDDRVAGNTSGDSNEWYFGEVDTFISVAKDCVE